MDTQPSFLHQQYLRQAGWTRALRYFLYRKVQLARRLDILELGSGSGAILNEVSQRTGAALTGIDADPQMTAFAEEQYPLIRFRTARAGKLPFKVDSFDLVLTHYFWLWQGDPERVLAEAWRVLKKGGFLVSLCEPDHEGRSDEPPELGGIKAHLIEALVKQGAYPGVPKSLGEMMSRAGFRTETGRQQNCWNWREYRKEFEAEWAFIRHLCGPMEELQSLKQKDRRAVAEKKRKLLMPVCWAIGQK